MKRLESPHRREEPRLHVGSSGIESAEEEITRLPHLFRYTKPSPQDGGELFADVLIREDHLHWQEPLLRNGLVKAGRKEGADAAGISSFPDVERVSRRLYL